jgi:rSAM/selenodomain-associated transferase 2
LKPGISIVIPVYDEAYTINQLLEHLNRQAVTQGFEIVMVDGHPAGTTAAAVSDKRVVIISSEKGRAVQMNRGAEAAKGHILLFLHADTFLPENALSKIADALSIPGNAAGAFDLGIRSCRSVYRIIEFGVRIRYHLTGIPYGDQAIFVKKTVFDRIKGYPEIPIMEDVAFMRSLKASGEQIVRLRCKVSTSARRWQKEGILRCTLRNYMLIMLYHFGVSPLKLAKHYR